MSTKDATVGRTTGGGVVIRQGDDLVYFTDLQANDLIRWLRATQDPLYK